jgi:hypothetical protein
MALIKFEDFDAVNEAAASKSQAKKLRQLVEEVWNLSNVVNFMQDEGLMTDAGKVKPGLTVEDINSNMTDQFGDKPYKNLDYVEGEFRDLVAACAELAKLGK